MTTEINLILLMIFSRLLEEFKNQNWVNRTVFLFALQGLVRRFNENCIEIEISFVPGQK